MLVLTEGDMLLGAAHQAEWLEADSRARERTHALCDNQWHKLLLRRDSWRW